HLWDMAPIVESTTYLGITIANAGRLNHMWQGVLREARIVSNKIRTSKIGPAKRALHINTYMIPLFGYLQRHFITPKSITNTISKLIRKAMGPYNYLPNRVLFATRGPFKLSPPIQHPFIVGL